MDYYDSSYGVYESSALSTGAVVANVIISLAPVSYTHLDVYKRQIIGVAALSAGE